MNNDSFYLVKRKSISYYPIHNLKNPKSKTKIFNKYYHHQKNKTFEGGIINLFNKNNNQHHKTKSQNQFIHKSFEENQIIPFQINDCRFTISKNKQTIANNNNKIYIKKRCVHHNIKINKRFITNATTTSNTPTHNKTKSFLIHNNQNTKVNHLKIKHLPNKSNLTMLTSPSFLSTQNNSFLNQNESLVHNKSFKTSLILSPQHSIPKENESNQIQYHPHIKQHEQQKTRNINIYELRQIKNNYNLIYPANDPFRAHIRSKSFGKYHIMKECLLTIKYNQTDI